MIAVFPQCVIPAKERHPDESRGPLNRLNRAALLALEEFNGSPEFTNEVQVVVHPQLVMAALEAAIQHFDLTAVWR